VINKEDCVSKVRDHLYNSDSYKKLKDNHISWIIKEVNRAIKDSNIDKGLKKCLLPSNEITSKIYEAPKIQKNGTPIRPIVNIIGLPHMH